MKQSPDHRRRGLRSAFSLIELVIVVVIIAIIGAIAIPKLSRGAAGANDSAVTGDLAVLRKALDLYQAEHGGSYPALATIVAQLTTYTDVSGNAQATADATHLYGPYIRQIPPLPVGARQGGTQIASGDAAGVGWIYDATSGSITANTSAAEADATGKLYSSY